MAHVHKGFSVRTITDISQGIPANAPGVPLVVEQDCSRIVIENADAANDIYLQSDPQDTATQKRIPKGNLELDLNAKSSGDAVFLRNDIVGYLVTKAGGATGPVTITFVR